MTALGCGLVFRDLAKKEKGLMDMDNSVVIVGGVEVEEGITGINDNGKKQYKSILKINKNNTLDLNG